MTLEQAQAQAIVAAMTEAGYEAEVREDYSGRFMYGATCPGIVTNCASMIGFFAGSIGMELKEVPMRCDDMGSSVVVY